MRVVPHKWELWEIFPGHLLSVTNVQNFHLSPEFLDDSRDCVDSKDIDSEDDGDDNTNRSERKSEEGNC